MTSIVVPVSSPELRTTSSMSRTICSKSAVASGWKTIAALPELLRPSSMSIFTYAVVIANSRSGAGCLSSRLPRRMSRKPTGCEDYAATWPWSWDSRRASAASRFSIGGCVANRPAMPLPTPAGKMKNAFSSPAARRSFWGI